MKKLLQLILLFAGLTLCADFQQRQNTFRFNRFGINVDYQELMASEMI
jgi:hypothetical protein